MIRHIGHVTIMPEGAARTARAGAGAYLLCAGSCSAVSRATASTLGRAYRCSNVPPVKTKSTEAVRDVAWVIVRGSPIPEVRGTPIVGHDVDVALTKAERQRAADLIQRLLDMVDDSDLAADGPAGVALVRRLEGAMIALGAMGGPMIVTGRAEPT